MKTKLLILFCSLAWNIGFAQNLSKIDSLKQALALAQADKDKVLILSDLSYEYLGADTDSALLLAQQAHDLAQKINFTRGEARALFHLGHTYRILSDIPNSMRASLRGMQLAEENGFRQEAALCNYNTGALYMGLLNDYPKALGYFKKARQWNSPVQGAIGESCRLTLDINYGTVYKQLNMPDSAEFYYNEALAHTADPNMRLVILNFKGLLQLKLKNYREALTFLRQATANKLNHRGNAEIYFNLASCFREMGQTDSCLFYAKNSLAEAEQIGYQQYVMKSATLLAEVYEGENNHQALRFYKTAKLANDEAYGEQKVQDLQRIITEELERQQVAERTRTAFQNRVRLFALLGGLGVALLIAFLLYRNNLQKQKTNARLQAQNRELEIEAALERVRSRAMAMRKTDELRSVIHTVFEQLKKLGFDATACGLTLFNKEDKSMTLWLAGFDTDAYPESYFVPWFDHPLYNAQFEAWENGQTYQVFKFEGKLKKSYDELIFELGDFKNLPSSATEAILSIETATNCSAFMKYGMLESIMIGDEVLTEQQAVTLQRFAKVFEQTYTRFLDLQTAEAQAREAQIEAALERVRSRAIAMRHSDELSEAAELLYKEFLKMGVESFSCGYLINDDETGEWKIWLTNPGEAFFKEFWSIPYEADHNLKARYESWKRKDEFHCAVLEGEENRAHHVVISKYAPWKEAMLDSLPPRLVFNSAHFSLGHLLVISPDRLAPDLEQAMARFAKVFDLTWRRFLDLQKAEARAREAKIDAGLDRVRAEIASMRATEDLERITPLVWRELTTLGVPFFRCGVFIMDEEKELVHTYLSTPDGKSLSVLHLPFDGAETTRKTVEHWRKQKVYLDNWDKRQFIDWVQSLTEQGYIKESKAYQGAGQPPEALALHFVPFKQGMLYVGNSEKLPGEQIDLVQRLADTFAVAYSRYEDFTRLEEAKRKVETTLTDLKSTQTQLIQSEKLASLGELTAGIAHEIQNPLNFVNNFSELSVDLAKEINEELDREAVDKTLVKELMTDLAQNQEKINHHGKRAAAIVSGMLQHARSSTGKKEPTDLNALADEYLRLSYHGLRAKDPNFNAKMEAHFDPAIGKVDVIPQDMGRVLLNLINNAFYAVQQRQRAEVAARDLPGFQNLEGLYAPTVTVSTQKTDNQIIIKVKDNGTGIPEEVKAKIFQPFFTTKPTGQGTGLGLSLAYDIVVKGHGGTVEVDTKEGEGTEFIIKLFVN